MFKVRLASSAALVVLTLILLPAGGLPLWVAVCLLSLAAFWELLRAAQGAQSPCPSDAAAAAGAPVDGDMPAGKPPLPLFFAGGAGILLYDLLLLWKGDLTFGLAAMIACFLGCMALYVFAFPKYHFRQIAGTFFFAFYTGVLFSFVYLLRTMEDGEYLVWLIFLCSWICDTCAYLTGMAIGRHRLAPVLSPKKSVEGAIGGVVGSALSGALFARIFLYGQAGDGRVVWVVAVVCAAGAVISQIGDLAASAIKRNYGIKDYGKLIPGHGGIMDRFDSVLFAAPVVYGLAKLLYGLFL